MLRLYITAGPQLYSKIVWLGRETSYHPTMICNLVGNHCIKKQEDKDKIWSLSLKVSLSVGLGGRGQAKGCCNVSCLSIVVRCGHVVWYRYRYKRLLKYQILQKLVTCLPQIVMFLVNPHNLCYRISIFTEIRAIFDSFPVFGLFLQYYATMAFSLVEREGIDWMQNTKGTSIYITWTTGRLLRLFSTRA